MSKFAGADDHQRLLDYWRTNNASGTVRNRKSGVRRFATLDLSAQAMNAALPSETDIRCLFGPQLEEAVAIHVFRGQPNPGWTLEDARVAEEIVIQKLGLNAYVGALTAMADGDMGLAMVAASQMRLRACLLALSRVG